MVDSTLTQLERDLLRVPGVKSVRVVGDDSPTEIHIVASSKRPPKQVVRDVQSLAAAGFGMPIDHRIVSVVQLDDLPPQAPSPQAPSPQAPSPQAPSPQAPSRPAPSPPAPSPPPPPTVPEAVDMTPHAQVEEEPPDHRLILERVVFASKGDSGWVKVALRWPDGTSTEGAGAAGSSREARARGAAQALLQALQPALGPVGAKLDVDQVLLQQLGTNDTVIARVVLYDHGIASPLVGSALVYDDVATAAVRAILQSINRKLRLNHSVSA
jgi:hypothetical protein